MIFDFVLAQREIITTARKNTVSERKKNRLGITKPNALVSRAAVFNRRRRAAAG
jgi:hypothetical protein